MLHLLAKQHRYSQVTSSSNISVKEKQLVISNKQNFQCYSKNKVISICYKRNIDWAWPRIRHDPCTSWKTKFMVFSKCFPGSNSIFSGYYCFYKVNINFNLKEWNMFQIFSCHLISICF